MIVNSISLRPDQVAGRERQWPFSVAPVASLVREPLRFTAPITCVTGANGSGKSTLVEAVAEAYGMDVRGGHGGRAYASNVERGPLGEVLELSLTGLGIKLKRRRGVGFFLRAETAHGVFSYMSNMDVQGYGEKHLDLVSHGEGFLQVLAERVDTTGLVLLDEPEAALSFDSCLALCDILLRCVANGSQVICSTHSPVLSAIPGAQLLHLDEDGISRIAWEDLEFVQHWRRFLDDPRRYFRHL